MVPTLTWGFVRSNFCLAIACYSLLSDGAPLPRRGDRTPLCLVLLRSVARNPWSGLLPLRPGDDLLGDRLGHLIIGVELHRVRGATLGARTQVSSVAEHVGQWNLCVDHVAAA